MLSPHSHWLMQPVVMWGPFTNYIQLAAFALQWIARPQQQN